MTTQPGARPHISASPSSPPPAASPVQPLSPPSLLPSVQEEVATALRKEGISFIFESRSLSAVVRYIYTPIEGNLSDLEVEINNTDAIRPAQGGGITIEMGNREWAADDEEIERHLISCEQVGEEVEARWQWKHGEELADFLFRFSIRGKTLLVELEGGHGKATGLSLGWVEGAPHPRLIHLPYFNLGEAYPGILCTQGTFLSSLLEMSRTRATQLAALPAAQAAGRLYLNGGCTYAQRSDGKRNPVHECWMLTVSRHFEEVIPPPPALAASAAAPLKEVVWYNIPRLAAAEEAYVEAYEQLRILKQWGMDKLLVNHPADTWRDHPGPAGFSLEASLSKGGDDALKEYLEAVADLGFKYSLYANYRDLSATRQQQAARQSDGRPVSTGPETFLLKPALAQSMGMEHAAALEEKFGKSVLYLDAHAATPPWDRVDCDAGLERSAALLSTLQADQGLLSALSRRGPAVGEGGSHWLYPGLLQGYAARLAGPNPASLPLLVDFDLHHLHPFQTDAGLGSLEQFFGGRIPADQKHSRSPYLDRYLAATLAFGHAACLPDIGEWGLAAALKTYFLIQPLQDYYLGAQVESIHYHHNGNFLELTEALISGAHEHSQLRIAYRTGFQLYVNGGWQQHWTVQQGDQSFSLPPASFLACGPQGVLAYSAEMGSGRLDCYQGPDYLYVDTRGARRNLGPVTVDGAVIVRHHDWAIDVCPIDCTDPIEVLPTYFWQDRRLPRLRVLAFTSADAEPETLKAETTEKGVVIQQIAGAYKYRVTLPEWMVAPGN
ncbi:MAG: hypothetical protein HYW07_10030 [Candidatus Latescibacteria bacterium]|nr:hypothetical protein [Candidatus Latescibacterota bacterium]